jgi:uncharacterized protein (TIGR00369 family)
MNIHCRTLFAEPSARSLCVARKPLYPIRSRQANRGREGRVDEEAGNDGRRTGSVPGPRIPGGTISGPTMMMLADFALYLAVLSAIGPVALAVTINFNINFLRRPEQRDLIADARMLKLGKRLAVMEVNLRSDRSDEPVAHVTSTYSIPPRSEA